MSDLRKSIIRLAHENPELRKDLLPLLKEARLPKHLQNQNEEIQSLLNRLSEGYMLMGRIESQARGAQRRYPDISRALAEVIGAVDKADSVLRKAVAKLEDI